MSDGISSERIRGLTVVMIKGLHTLIWAAVEASVVYLLVQGMMGRSDRKSAIAGAVVGLETTVFLANGARCPLTQVVENLGEESGSVTDIYLPGWFARILPAIHAPVLVAIAYLHWRHLFGDTRQRA